MFDPVYDVAVVVPIFNVERYLQECLDSLARQTIFDRCQVILVDNGSVDSSPGIATAFAAQYQNVWAFVHPEGKAGGARNAGMDLVSARYITFCDSDDVLPDDALETMWRTAVKERVPLTIGRMETFPEETNWPWLRYFGSGVQVHPGIDNIPEMIHGGSACHKLFDVEFIRANNIRFREGVHFEDAFFSVPAMLLADRIAMVPSTVYRYRKRAAEDSTMDKLWERKANYWDHLLLEEYLVSLRPRLSGHRQEVLNRFLVRSYQGFALRAPEAMHESELFQLFERARAVYTQLTPDAIVSSTHDTRHRVPFLAMYLNWFELFARPEQVISGVYGRGGDLYLDLSVPSALLSLTKVSATSVHVERIQPAPNSDEILVAGRFVLNGLPMKRPMRNPMQLWPEKSGQLVPARQVWRSDLKATRDDLEWGGFEALLPVEAVKDGEFPLKLVFCTSGRDVSRPCMSTTAMLRGARGMKAAGHWVLPLSKGKDQVSLVVREVRGKGGNRDWEEFLQGMDQDQKKRKAPFWRARSIRRMTLRFFRGKEIWLIGERKDTAQDNSLHLFTYLRKHERRRKVYYIIDKQSADLAKLKRLGNVVAHGSWKHKLLLLHASLLVNAYDIDSYMLPDDWDRTKYLKHLNWRVGARRVFLQHGVTDEDGSKALHRNRTGVDLVFATSQREADYFSEHMHYGAQAQALGFPRFDALQPDRGGRRILLMPTWRKYLTIPSYLQGDDADQNAVEEIFRESSYRDFYVRLLRDPRLMKALEYYDYVLDFLPHYEMRNMIGGVVPDHPRVQRLDQTKVSVQTALRQCDLFITDWSSVHFDMAYLGTPLIYSRFDPDEYWAKHARKGYFEAAHDGFGPVCETVSEVVDEVIRYLANGCRREPEYDRRARAFFAFEDRDNCARATDAIARLAASDR
ncbi:glycosyltransferase [Streptomyces sp. SID8379]|uniref:bifunctional glycosyltransferase/CDP-glycerol:glycerophosphate glycerophosphotransferase n=1 Tax=unclassified Streptomyces TaxID=2593676 RepID=UPI00037132D5|nr:CDP-glycerol glycerophosphotransferase family protein [Streptomyces sp. HmicA12]MYW64086.1 glycosyltransferase [Streptomyces sp. SID8379]